MKLFKTCLLALAVTLAPAALAKAPVAPVTTTAAAPAAAATPATPASETPGIATTAPDPMIGQPVEGKIGIQPQVTAIGQQALWMHDVLLIPIITVISLFVLGLLLWCMAVYRRKANPVPAKFSHNTTIEVVWTLVPILVLLLIVFPSIALLHAQAQPAGKGAVTVKAIGNQWFWNYDYPDYGDIEVTSNMLPDAEAAARHEPRLLGVTERMVIPVNTPIRLLATSNDVIHAFAMPAFWTKIDAVPGRTNEVTFTVEREGVYFGQCSELCGVRHGFMPIAVQVVSKEDFAKWVVAKGGKMPSATPAAAAAAPAIAAPAATAEAAPANATAAANATATNATAPAAAALTNTGTK